MILALCLFSSLAFGDPPPAPDTGQSTAGGSGSSASTAETAAAIESQLDAQIATVDALIAQLQSCDCLASVVLPASVSVPSPTVSQPSTPAPAPPAAAVMGAGRIGPRP